MTFNAGIPNPGQSPALFPAQMQTDLGRLKALINAEHQFNDTAGVTDGVHKQMTMINRAAPTTVPVGTNAMLYTILDSNGFTQLHFYNAVTDIALTPPADLYPIRLVGSSVTLVAAGANFNIPGLPNEYTGSGYAYYEGSNSSSFHNFMLINGNSDEHEIYSTSGSSPAIRYNGSNVLQVRNDGFIPKVIWWSLILNKIS